MAISLVAFCSAVEPHRTQLLPTICVHVGPGGRGLTVGVKEFGPPGVSGATCFSVGDSVGAEDDVADPVGVPVVGASVVLVLQPVARTPEATTAAPPTNSAIRRFRSVAMTGLLSEPRRARLSRV
jgi:hypothetical protein